MKKFLRFIWLTVEFIIIVYVIILTSFLLCKNKYGYTQFGSSTIVPIDLLGEKNNPKTKDGDLLIVKNSNDIKEGDLIYYYVVYNENYIVKSSPVISINNDEYSYLYTVDDSGPTSIVGTRVLGKYANTYSSLGSVLNFLLSRIGFLFFALLPILVVFIYRVYDLVMILRYERVEIDNLTKKESSNNSAKNEENSEKESSSNSTKKEENSENDIETL